MLAKCPGALLLREVGSAAHQRLALHLGNKAGYGGSAGPVQDLAQQECVASLQVDLKTPPWPSISAPAKDLVLKLLNRDPVARLTAQQVRAPLAACRSGWRATAALPFPHAPLPSPSSPPLQPASCAHGVAPSAQLSCSSETLRHPWTDAQALEHPWLREQGVASDKPMDSVVIARIQQFSANSRFKKAAIGVMATCLSPAELSGLEHLFQSIDADNSGTINASELRQALQSMGSKIPDDQLQARAFSTVRLSRCRVYEVPVPRTPHRPPRPWVPQAAELRVFAQLHTSPQPLPPLLQYCRRGCRPRRRCRSSEAESCCLGTLRPAVLCAAAEVAVLWRRC